MHQSKDTDRQIGWKAKTHQYAASRPISHARIHKDSKQRDRGRFTNQMESKKKKKAGVAILVSDKIDFKGTKIKRGREKNYIMVKGSIQQEELTILNIYGPNTGEPRYIRQVLNDLQRDLDSHTIIVGDFNTPLSILDDQPDRKLTKISRT